MIYKALTLKLYLTKCIRFDGNFLLCYEKYFLYPANELCLEMKVGVLILKLTVNSI